MSKLVTIPLVNPNEPEALLAGLSVEEGQEVSAGDLLCTLETTKSTADVHAENDGFVVNLIFAEGETVRAGDPFCYLADTADWTPPAPALTATDDLAEDENGQGRKSGVPAGLRITKPALALAREAGFDLEQLPRESFVTEKLVRERLASAPDASTPAAQADFDPTAIVIYGGGGHGKACLELLQATGAYRVVGFVDDGLQTGGEIMGLPVLGGGDVLPGLYAEGVRLAVNAVGGIGNVGVRIKVFGKLAEAGFGCPTLVHPRAVVEPSAELSPGVQVFALAYVGSEARVGFGCIINTSAVVSHDCVLGDFVNISPGAILAGEVEVGARALVGMGATVNLQASVGSDARIGNGAAVKSDVPVKGIVQAGTIWPK